MDRKGNRAPTPGADGKKGVGSIAVLGDGVVRDTVLKAYMREYYLMVAEEVKR